MRWQTSSDTIFAPSDLRLAVSDGVDEDESLLVDGDVPIFD